MYGTEENFYKTFLQEARFLYAIDGHEPEDDVEKAEIYLTGLKEFSSVSFDYENGKVTSDVIIDNY